MVSITRNCRYLQNVTCILLVETIPTRFCWLTFRKENLGQSKALLQRLLILISGFWQRRKFFLLLLNDCFDDIQINRWLYLSSNLLEIPLCCDLFWKRIDQQNSLFMEIHSWIVLAVWWSVKYLFAPHSPIYRIRLAEPREEEHNQLLSVTRFTQMQKVVVQRIFIQLRY